jgi:hypothetical protein
VHVLGGQRSRALVALHHRELLGVSAEVDQETQQAAAGVCAGGVDRQGWCAIVSRTCVMMMLVVAKVAIVIKTRDNALFHFNAIRKTQVFLVLGVRACVHRGVMMRACCVRRATVDGVDGARSRRRRAPGSAHRGTVAQGPQESQQVDRGRRARLQGRQSHWYV